MPNMHEHIEIAATVTFRRFSAVYLFSAMTSNIAVIILDLVLLVRAK